MTPEKLKVSAKENFEKKNFNHMTELVGIFGIITFITWPKSKKNNLAIFGPFFDLEEFFKNRGLIFETSDSNLCQQALSYG